MNPYIQDILSQPQALRAALENYSDDALRPLVARLGRLELDRIIIAGMGASYNAAYPAYLHLTGHSTPVMLINAAELLHAAYGLIGERTFLWLNSQSGRSAELVNLVERIQPAPPAALLACVNDTSSPLAAAANYCVPIHAGPEATVSTRTYVNMLATNLLVALTLTGADLGEGLQKLSVAADAMEIYLMDWQAHMDELELMLAPLQDGVILGRGTSLAAVWNGSLINKEAAKCAFEGMHAADFRHGPLELVSPRLTAIIFEGALQTAHLNHELALNINRLGGNVIWIASQPDATLSTVRLPAVADVARPLVEILPLQLLTLVMARQKGIEPGVFRYVPKVTLQE
jgi:glutamine---fructose-6-phosphate transaminase (isomerizing)